MGRNKVKEKKDAKEHISANQTYLANKSPSKLLPESLVFYEDRKATGWFNFLCGPKKTRKKVRTEANSMKIMQSASKLINNGSPVPM